VFAGEIWTWSRPLGASFAARSTSSGGSSTAGDGPAAEKARGGSMPRDTRSEITVSACAVARSTPPYFFRGGVFWSFFRGVGVQGLGSRVSGLGFRV
jgi:hypothetical protein